MAFSATPLVTGTGPLRASLTVRGLDELDAMLRTLPDEVAGPIMQAALTAAGELIQRAAAGNVHSRTGKTAADIRVQVQVHPEQASGVAAIGGTRRGADARGWVLRLLEFGARGKKHGNKGWDIVGGSTDQKLARKAIRALRRTGQATAAAALRFGVSEGDISTRRALKLPGNVFRARAHHPGFAPQAPLTRALAESASAAVEVFSTTLWQRLTQHVDTVRAQQGG
jgi:hypothetical protein